MYNIYTGKDTVTLYYDFGWEDEDDFEYEAEYTKDDIISYILVDVPENLICKHTRDLMRKLYDLDWFNKVEEDSDEWDRFLEWLKEDRRDEAYEAYEEYRRTCGED